MSDTLELDARLPKMLIADDDPAIVRLLADRCAGVGFAVETATNGLQALIKAKRSHPDILIIDVNMPETDGLSVCARLLDSDKKRLDVVVVTGSRENETAERCQSFGAFFVRKGPEFWTGLSAALTERFPGMADKIKGLHGHPLGAEMRQRPRVLMIDPDVAIELFLSSRLDKCGVELLCTSDIPQGYRIACKQAPAVILCEHAMPNGGVPYLLSKLRTNPVTENIPVFVFSREQIDIQSQNSLMLEVWGKPGVAQIFRKKFDTSELFGALQKVCGFANNRTEDTMTLRPEALVRA